MSVAAHQGRAPIRKHRSRQLRCGTRRKRDLERATGQYPLTVIPGLPSLVEARRVVCAQWHANSRAVGAASCSWIERWSVCEVLLASAAMSRDHCVLHAGRARDEIAASESPHTCKFARPWCTSARQTCECPDRSAPPDTRDTFRNARGGSWLAETCVFKRANPSASKVGPLRALPARLTQPHPGSRGREFGVRTALDLGVSVAVATAP